jgi:uncharacterized membrane protein YkvA (DUF1232 family)
MQDAGLSPEHFGERLGIAGMTLRRWRKSPPDGDLPKKYETALIDAMSQLVAEGKLNPDSPSVKAILKERTNLSISSALKNLGLTFEDLKSSSARPDAMEDVLSRIGMDSERQRQVDRSGKAYAYFQKLGRSWQTRIKVLRWVVTSTELSLTDKLVAYGALFYLISPVQLLPNYIPVVGLLDDYAVIVMAVTYYMRRFGPMLEKHVDLELDPV